MTNLYDILFIFLSILAIYWYYSFENKRDNIKRKTDSTKALPKPEDNRLKIVGIGGGGCNIVDYLFLNYFNIYNPLIINSDKKALDSKKVHNKLLLQKNDIYGCGSNEKCGFELVNQNIIDKILNYISSTKEIYLIATLGGGVGGGSTRAIVEKLFDLDISINLIIVYPFSWEGAKRKNRATQTYESIKPFCKKVYLFNPTSSSISAKPLI